MRVGGHYLPVWPVTTIRRSRNNLGRQKSRRQLETPIHLGVYHMLLWKLPKRAIIHHSPNEFDMSGDVAAKLVAKAKQMGMRPGWPDLEFVLDGVIYFLEVKNPENGRVTPDQAEVHAELRAAGAMVAVVTSITEAEAQLQAWGIDRRKPAPSLA